jgi:hypothetical protein
MDTHGPHGLIVSFEETPLAACVDMNELPVGYRWTASIPESIVVDDLDGALGALTLKGSGRVWRRACAVGCLSEECSEDAHDAEEDDDPDDDDGDQEEDQKPEATAVTLSYYYHLWWWRGCLAHS